jgi:hypothetical protein
MEVIDILKHALMITVFVFVMMLLVDYVDMVTRRRMSMFMQGSQWRQYALTSFFGSTPGCLGAFMNVSLYVHGMITFGAIVGGMIATSGDEAFVMLAQFPGPALVLFGMLFFLGILFAWVSDKLVDLLGIVPCEACDEHHCEECQSASEDSTMVENASHLKDMPANLRSLSFSRFLLLTLICLTLFLFLSGMIGPAAWDWKRVTFVGLALCSLFIASVASEHYLQEHIWDHIIKKHLLRVFLWTFGALMVVHWGLGIWNLEIFIGEHIIWVLLIGALVGIIPESGPHLVFVMLYAEGMVPFSVLFTTSFVQDGHGMLPMLSYSIRDSLLIKAFNLVFGITVGVMIFALGF